MTQQITLIDEEIIQCKQRLDGLWAQQREINDTIQLERKKLQQLMAVRLSNRELTLADILMVYIEGEESEYLDERREKYFDNKKRKLGIKSGMTFDADTNQHHVDIIINKKMTSKQIEKLAKYLEEELLPVIIPGKTEMTDGVLIGKYMGIFEHSLSANGSYSFCATDNKYYVIKSYYRISGIEFESTSLIDILKYIQKNHWYG